MSGSRRNALANSGTTRGSAEEKAVHARERLSGLRDYLSTGHIKGKLLFARGGGGVIRKRKTGGERDSLTEGY